jgi:hypothetical protein
MMLDEPVQWDDTIDKEQAIDYMFVHQRMTKVNDVMLAQYGATRDAFIGTTRNQIWAHNLADGRDTWRRLHVPVDCIRSPTSGVQMAAKYGSKAITFVYTTMRAA